MIDNPEPHRPAGFLRIIWMGWRYWRGSFCGEGRYYGWRLMAGFGPVMICLWPIGGREHSEFPA